MNIAIIPARGGSKRIPRKNIQLFSNKPMISYAISTAKQSGCFDHIVVSTEDAEIAEIAKKWGAEVPFFRPAKLADDYADTLDVLKHTIGNLTRVYDKPNFICCIYPCTPLMDPEIIIDTYNEMKSKSHIADYVFTACDFDFPIWRSLKVGTNGLASPIFPEFIESRSQDLDHAIHDAGQIYWGKTDAFLNKKDIFSNGVPFIIPRYSCVDIDNQDDWELAEKLYKIKNLNKI